MESPDVDSCGPRPPPGFESHTWVAVPNVPMTRAGQTAPSTCPPHNRRQKHWHADETRWLVFATVEGKVGHRWFLWVFHSPEVVVFVLDSGRAHDVPEDHLGPVKEGILSVDRYAAYKAMKQVKEGLILLAFCWAHVRRDFLGAARSWPTEEEWALGWVGRIGQLYKDNEARLQALPTKPAEFVARDGQLQQHVAQMAEQAK